MNELINGFLTAINDTSRGFCNFAGSMFIQSTVLILLLLFIDLLIRKRIRATFRYWIWMLVFIKLVLPPSLSSPTGIGNLFGEYFSADSIVAESPAKPVRRGRFQRHETRIDAHGQWPRAAFVSGQRGPAEPLPALLGRVPSRWFR